MSDAFPPIPEAVMVGDQRLTIPATDHEQHVIEAALNEYGEQLRAICSAQGVDLLAFVVPRYRRVVTPDDLASRSIDGLGLD